LSDARQRLRCEDTTQTAVPPHWRISIQETQSLVRIENKRLKAELVAERERLQAALTRREAEVSQLQAELLRNNTRICA